MAKAGRGSDQFVVRLPPGMRDQIKRAADESGRSMNSEILDVLREYFPVEPDLGELIDELEYTMVVLKEMRENSATGNVAHSSKFQSLLAQMRHINEGLSRSLGEDHISPVVMLRNEVMEGIRNLQAEYEIPKGMVDSLASDLIQMSLNRIASGDEKLKAWIGEGEAQTMIEFDKPSSLETSER